MNLGAKPGMLPIVSAARRGGRVLMEAGSEKRTAYVASQKSMKSMRILFLGPLPEPTTGHSLACQVLLDALVEQHDVDIVNLSKPELRSGFSSFSRYLSIAHLLRSIYRKRRYADVVYLTIAESIAGNIKDLLIYSIFRKRLECVVVHLHGGSIRKWIFDRFILLRAINRWFLSRIGAVIVLGDSHVDIFSDMVPRPRIHIVPNFAQDEIFATEQAVDRKFADTNPVRLLFLSNLIEGKGHSDLVEAYRRLDPELRRQLEIDFAGAFDSERDKETFLASIADAPGIRYHGVVRGEAKKALLDAAHIFCLPTSLFEGQPISILEAYAGGCVVMTTLLGGIPDIFADGVNGFAVHPNSPESISDVLARVLRSPQSLLSIAQHNQRIAKERYRTLAYTQHVEAILREAARGDA